MIGHIGDESFQAVTYLLSSCSCFVK